MVEFEINIKDFEDSLVLFFGGPFEKINAYTLASCLVSVADAAKFANAQINPGYDLEVLVESFATGSFKTKISVVYHKLGNLFSAADAKSVVLGVLASHLFQITLAPDPNIQVVVNTNEVVITAGTNKVVVPREVYDATKLVERRPEFTNSIKKVFRAVAADENIQSIGIARNLKEKMPPINIPHEKFAVLAENIEKEEENLREVLETTELQIVRAILERGKRLWEFVWRGVRIPAPVLDNKFYDQFFAHKVTIAPGDVLKVRMRILQLRDPDTGIYTNSKYEVLEVLEHHPSLKQASMGF